MESAIGHVCLGEVVVTATIGGVNGQIVFTGGHVGESLIDVECAVVDFTDSVCDIGDGTLPATGKVMVLNILGGYVAVSACIGCCNDGSSTEQHKAAFHVVI